MHWFVIHVRDTSMNLCHSKFTLLSIKLLPFVKEHGDLSCVSPAASYLQLRNNQGQVRFLCQVSALRILRAFPVNFFIMNHKFECFVVFSSSYWQKWSRHILYNYRTLQSFSVSFQKKQTSRQTSCLELLVTLSTKHYHTKQMLLIFQKKKKSLTASWWLRGHLTLRGFNGHLILNGREGKGVLVECRLHAEMDKTCATQHTNEPVFFPSSSFSSTRTKSPT